MRPQESRQEKLQRLASRVAAGEVVFFIGAGFSLESERNSTEVLIARLLARLEALAEHLTEHGDEESRNTARRVRRALRTTFWLKQAKTDAGKEFASLFDITDPSSGNPDDKSILQTNITSLAQNYYLINDWTCTAFESLIARLAADPNARTEAVDTINARENEHLDAYHEIDKLKNTARLEPFNLEWLLALHAAETTRPDSRERAVAGKALFLETLGFLNPKIMGGEPTHPSLAEAVRRSSHRILPRHHVLAWLAAEGLSGTLVTTNYDLLIECAYRSAGLLPLNPPEARWGRDVTALQAAERERIPTNVRNRYYTRVASAADFFTHGDAQQTVLIHKMHGCVDSYRIAYEKSVELLKAPPSTTPAASGGPFAMVRALLPTIVFTFREIQNWRDDAWSRDYLSTLLRTRTVVFAGYSGADPVVHDTFRTVYEDMASQSARMADASVETHSSGSRAPRGGRARAFFLDLDEKREFYGLELLRAAGLAGRDASLDLSDHPNLITFFRTSQDAFPNLDDVFVWLYHLTMRQLQAEALEAGLRRVACQLFGTPPPESEAASIVQLFETLRQKECRHARLFDAGSRARRVATVRAWFRATTSWTQNFLVQLLREYELGLALLRNLNDSHLLRSASEIPWYRPVNEHLDWCAWAVVLELAIRRKFSFLLESPKRWHRTTVHLYPADGPVPGVQFRAEPFRRGDRSVAVRRSLTIQLSTMRQLFRQRTSPREFSALSPLAWQLQPGAVPWWTERDDRRPATTPSARTLWNWAVSPGALLPQDPAEQSLRSVFRWPPQLPTARI